LGPRVDYRRSGLPDTGVCTSHFRPLSHVQGPPGRRESAPRLQEHSRRLSGALERVAEGRQKNREFFSGMVRGVSNPREGSKILSFLIRPRLVCSSLLHLRSSWMVNSANFAFTVLRSSFTSRAALPWCSDVLCALAHIHSTQTRVRCVRCVANRPPAA
jgi:hypothetical protein